jgi:hypothetical protein
VLSPDGRYVASNEADALIVYDVDTGATREVPRGPDPGRLVRWSNDPDVVYVMEIGATGGRLYRRNIVTGERRFVRDIRITDPAGITRFEPWVSRDGQSYAYGLDRALANLFVLRNIR